MPSNFTRSIGFGAILTIAVACGGGGATPAPATPAPQTSAPSTSAPQTPAASASTGVTGNVDIHGSSTVAPISNAVAQALQDANPEFSYFVGDEGTGAGFSEFFCTGDSDISDASRKIRAENPDTPDPEESTVCADNGVEYVELKVAYDGLAVITAVDNPIECLTFADLYALIGPEADTAGPAGDQPTGGPVTNWDQAEALAHELGSTTDLPDAQLSITAPGDESGTYDSFIELVLASFIAERFPDAASENTHLRAPGSIYVASANDNAIIQGVGGFPTSLGFVGLAYAEENTATVKMIAIDKAGDGNCVLPTRENVSDASYPISRSLYIYPNLGRAAENPAISAYVDFYLSDEGIAHATDVGYVELHPDELEATRQAWADAKP